MSVQIRDPQIFDIRNYKNDYRFDLNDARQLATSQGYEYMLWNGAIVSAKTDETIFYPPAGFWIPSTLPFIGWKEGYSYVGKHLWLLGDKDVGCAVIPLRQPVAGTISTV